MPPTSAPLPAAATGGFSGFGAALFAALWAYSGWQYLPMAASEVREPQRNLPRAIVGGTLLVLAIYLLVNTAYLYALPFWQVASANSTAYPEAPSVAARAVQTFLGERGAGGRRADLPHLHGRLAERHDPHARARLVRGGARRPVLPRFRALEPATPVYRSPRSCCLRVGGDAGRCRAPSTNSPTWPCMSYALFWIPVIARGDRARRRWPDVARPFRVPGYPLVPLVVIIVMAWIVVSAFLTTPKESIATLVLILLGLPLYPFFRRRDRTLLSSGSDSSSHSVSGAPRLNQNPKPASRN